MAQSWEKRQSIKESQYWDTNPDAEISIRGFQSVVKSEKENMLVRKNRKFQGKKPPNKKWTKLKSKDWKIHEAKKFTAHTWEQNGDKGKPISLM